MRPAVKHRLVTLAAGATLLLCVDTVALWVRSCYIGDEIGYFGGGFRIASNAGRTHFGVLHTPSARTPFLALRHFRPDDSLTFLRLNVLGFSFAQSPSGHWTDCTVPFWFVTVVTALPFMYWVVRRRRACQPGRCPTCGYDLRATPGRCPECGAVPAATEVT
jgi:hypothetical protein